MTHPLFPGNVGRWRGDVAHTPDEHYTWSHPSGSVVGVYPSDDPMAAMVWSVWVQPAVGEPYEIGEEMTIARAFVVAADYMESHHDGRGVGPRRGTAEDFDFTGGDR